MARGGRREGAGRRLGTPNRRTVAKLIEASHALGEAKKQDVPRAIRTLADLMVTAMGFTAHYQRKMIAFEEMPENAGKIPPQEIVDRFMAGLHTAIRAAAALAPYQDPKFANIKVTMSSLDMPEAPNTVEGKDLKIDLKDPIELARIYHSLVRAA